MLNCHLLIDKFEHSWLLEIARILTGSLLRCVCTKGRIAIIHRKISPELDHSAFLRGIYFQGAVYAMVLRLWWMFTDIVLAEIDLSAHISNHINVDLLIKCWRISDLSICMMVIIFPEILTLHGWVLNCIRVWLRLVILLLQMLGHWNCGLDAILLVICPTFRYNSSNANLNATTWCSKWLLL